MQIGKLQHFFFLLCLILGQPSFAAECDSANNTKHLAAVRDHFEESPFIVACKSPPGLLQGRPSSGVFTVPEEDRQAHSTRAFLKDVIKQVRARIAGARLQMDDMEKCIPLRYLDQCKQDEHWYDVELPQYLKDARYNLSLAQNYLQWSTWMGISGGVNENLSPEWTFRHEKWAALTPAELATAKKTLKKYAQVSDGEREVRTALGQMKPNEGLGFMTSALASARYKHFLAYEQILASVPLLQYLKGPTITHADVTSAFKAMSVDLKKESDQLDYYEKLANRPGPISTELLGLMNYNSQVEEALLQDPSRCGLATSLVYLTSHRATAEAVTVGGPILGVSFLAPPAAGLLLGVGVTGYYTKQDYDAYKASQQKQLGYIFGLRASDLAANGDAKDNAEKDAGALNVADFEDLGEQKRNLERTAVILPFGFGAVGALSNAVTRVSPEALAVGMSLFKAAP